MSDRSKALAATIAYIAGIIYMIHINHENPETMVNVLAIVGLVTVAYLLVKGAIVIIEMLLERAKDV